MTSLVPRDDRPPVPAMVITACYPLTEPPQQSLTDASQLLIEVLAIFTQAGDRLAAVLRKPYPCALCPTDMAGWPDWQRQRHFAQHPLKDRARVLGWWRAVMGT